MFLKKTSFCRQNDRSAGCAVWGNKEIGNLGNSMFLSIRRV